jgi:hypothetical protein
MMFRDIAATGEAAWAPSSGMLPPEMPKECSGDSSGGSEFKDDQCDLDFNMISLGQT